MCSVVLRPPLVGHRSCKQTNDRYIRFLHTELQNHNCILLLYLIFSGVQPSIPLSRYIPDASSPSFLLPCSVFPPQGKGYSVLLFEVDICIIRLGCVIVSGLPHQRVLQRREGAVQLNNGGLPSSLTLQPACTCIPPTRASGRLRRQSTFGLAAVEGVIESERKRRGRRGFECMMGVGGQGLS